MQTHAGALAFLTLLLALPGLAAADKAPPKHTSTIGTQKTIVPAKLKPGEYVWHPEMSPKGPVVLVVSLPEQRAFVYRNGVLIGASTVSTGKKGHETPAAADFTVLTGEKQTKNKPPATSSTPQESPALPPTR